MTTYALVGASEFSSEQFSARNGAGAFDAVIAVDGGFASLAAVGCAPDLAIGDFDSLGYVPEGVEVLAFPPEKDASDMELALGEAVARGADAVEVYGALGGRLDHTLANLQLLASFAERGLTVTAVGERERIAFLVGPGELPDIALVAPPAVIGTNTVEAIQSGIMLGEADRVDGLVRRIFDQLGYSAKVIATGGLAAVVERYSSTIDEVNTELTLEGLRLIADRAYR